MSKPITGKKIASNVIISIAVQAVSLAVSLITNLFVPKIIDKTQYSFWQMFMLYQSYVGLLHFGILDGILLRYSQYDYEELDKGRIRSQLRFLLVITSVMTLITSGISLLTLEGPYKTVFIFVGISIITKNFFTYGSYTFQITNRIKKYAFLILLQRGIFGLVIVGLLAFRVNDFTYYCLAEMVGDLLSTLVLSFFNKEMYIGKTIGLKEGFKELKSNVSSGILLLIANWSFVFVVSSARMFVQWRWSTDTFADVSFSFSVSNLFLTFATAISVVLFPSLKRVEQEKLPSIYGGFRFSVSVLLFFVLALYFPGCIILKWWLPVYENSLVYLGILLPIIVYSSKVNLLTNSYLKVYRKEKIMAIINVSSIVLGVGLFSAFAFGFNSIEGVLVSIVVVLMLNSVCAELVVTKIININIIKDIIIEVLMTAVFVLCTMLLSFWVGFAVYSGVFVVYCLINYKKMKTFLFSLKRGNSR